MSKAIDSTTTIPTRRALLAGAPAAAAGALAAGTAVNAVAAATTDGELLELGRRMDALTAEYWRIHALDRPWIEAYNALVDEFRRRDKEGSVPDGAAFLAEMKEIEDRYRQTNPSADDMTEAMDKPARRIMALPAFTPAGLAVKARAAAFACSHFYQEEELHDADWDHQHVRTLIDGVLAMAGKPPVNEEYGFGTEPSPKVIDPSLLVAARYIDASNAFAEACEIEDGTESATMEAEYDARQALFSAEPTTVAGVAALLMAVTKNDTDVSPIDAEISNEAADKVNDFLRRLAAVLRDEA
jgi:hypothetical protein